MMGNYTAIHYLNPTGGAIKLGQPERHNATYYVSWCEQSHIHLHLPGIGPYNTQYPMFLGYLEQQTKGDKICYRNFEMLCIVYFNSK